MNSMKNSKGESYCPIGMMRNTKKHREYCLHCRDTEDGDLNWGALILAFIMMFIGFFCLVFFNS